MRQFVEGLHVMEALWTEPEARFEGDFWRLGGIAMKPKPLRQPHPPIWFGGRHPDALRRAVRLGDGWIGSGSHSSPEDFRQRAAEVRQILEEEGRDPATFTIAKRVYIVLDDDRERGGRRLAEWFGQRYRNADMAATTAVWGNAQDCIDGIAEYVQAGAQLLQLNPVFDRMEYLEALARDVVPRL